MNTTPAAKPERPPGGGSPLHEQIEQCARELWLQHGCPRGEDLPLWLEAERRLVAAQNTLSPAPRAAGKSREYPGMVPAGPPRAAVRSPGPGGKAPASP